MIRTIKHIIQIDDDPSHNLLCKVIVKRTFADPRIDVFQYPDDALEFIEKKFTKPSLDSFIDPEDALKYIKSEYSNPDVNTKVLLLLDINMPVMSGWEFLIEFKKFSKHIQDQFTIYILSSSVDLLDKKMAADCGLVAGFISKPLKQETLTNLFFPENLKEECTSPKVHHINKVF